MAPPAQQPPPRSPLLKWICIALLSLIVIIGLVILIIYLSVHPKKLKYSIEQGSITGYNLTHNRLNANFYFVLRADNLNKRMSLYYDRIDVTVSYEDQKVSVNNVHPFYQRRRNVTNVDLYLVAKDAVVNAAAIGDLKRDKAAGNVDLDLKIRAKIRFKVGVFKIHRKLQVDCGTMTVPLYTSKGFKRVLCDTDIDN
ncbi:hypothetical protein BUALT_Bualt13G0067500 [Buddleja alternifolia]|uniref:Late embryogenesis abundant protein LEA-2 subgroup domain-containing protein n=1 Tax=Buddleja alternifolia TaxID=168488 RepID=A0AAV6WMC4_9LAMI|nr:hypothetical protein BUALT_Bualt13G0067500 [Buddleja alternifolia]